MFLGFTGFYRRFIRNYSRITASFIDLLKENAKGSLNLLFCACVVFKLLMLAFIAALLLRYYNPAFSIQVEIDALAYAIRVILLQ